MQLRWCLRKATAGYQVALLGMKRPVEDLYSSIKDALMAFNNIDWLVCSSEWLC